MEKRYVECIYKKCNHLLDRYQIKKEGENVGREYSIKGLFDFISRLDFEFAFDERTAEDIMAEGNRRRERKFSFVEC